uniref:Uncharacterized protein n=1 Tax=Ditylum brightwellii TaxID=49249 RepID=A0A7S2EB96_9STRA|mmetsp:Transcript_2288/g.3577  ORF Transcript_2288/g.3577 Transcript_2288/m.3577 type:complete len:908 (+) Transcript_2288:136-2859(+)
MQTNSAGHTQSGGSAASDFGPHHRSTSLPSVSTATPSVTNSATQRASPTPRREVDYYHNPTELFRWINYRRWDGAKARVLTHPDECSTWIVSRHSSDGRVLWRHLPLHLVCMQSGAGGNAPQSEEQGNAKEGPEVINRRIEELIDALLDSYPEGAASPDDQGMLPLHLVVNSQKPSEKVVHSLLLTNPSAVDTKDKYGRNPLDILREKQSGGVNRESILRILNRAKLANERIASILREETTSVVAGLKQTSENERMASQRIIIRLEEELATLRNQVDDVEHQNRNEVEGKRDMEREISDLKKKLDDARIEMDSREKERNDILDHNRELESQLNDHNKVVDEIKNDVEAERQEQSDTIATLKSEVSTARAMAEAMESQLRSRFTNEEYLTTTVAELEEQISDLNSKFRQEKKTLLHERDSLENENTQLKRSVDDLTKKNLTLQTKMTDLNKQMSNVLSAHGALNAEHDRLIEAAARHEEDMLENIRSERTRMVSIMEKQREALESAISQQDQLMEESTKKESELLEMFSDERERGMEVIQKMRQDFREARASLTDRERRIQAENISAARTARAGIGSKQSNGGVDHDNISTTMSIRSMKSDNNTTSSVAMSSSKRGNAPAKGTPATSRIASSRGSVSGSVARSTTRNGGDSILPVPSSQQHHGKDESTISATSPMTSPGMSSVSYRSTASTGKYHKQRQQQRQMESRGPSVQGRSNSSISTRQGPGQPEHVTTGIADGHLIQMLEDRAEQNHSGKMDMNLSSSTNPTPLSSPSVYGGHVNAYERPQERQGRYSSQLSARGDMNKSTTSSRTGKIRHEDLRRRALFSPSPPSIGDGGRSMSIDEYSHASCSTDTSESRGGGASRISDVMEYSGMSSGLKMGMIRIQESSSLPFDSETRGRDKFTIPNEE